MYSGGSLISQMVEIAQAGPEHLLVKPVQSGCHSCSSGTCGATNLAQLFGKQSHLLKVTRRSDQFKAGDIAELLLDESIFIRSVMVQYLLPLVSMFILVLIASLISQHLVFQVIAAIFGLAIGVFVSRYVIRWYEYRLDDEHLRIQPLQSPELRHKVR